MSLLDELNPTCPRGCGRTMDDCHESEDGGECEGGELLDENERLKAELGIAEDLVAAGITKRDKLRAELRKLRAELAAANAQLANALNIPAPNLAAASSSLAADGLNQSFPQAVVSEAVSHAADKTILEAADGWYDAFDGRDALDPDCYSADEITLFAAVKERNALIAAESTADGPERTDEPKAHAYSSHGWPCCDDAPAEQPRLVAKCGGPGLCTLCKVWANQVHLGFPMVRDGDDGPAASVSAQAEAGKGVDPNDCPGCHGDAGQVARHVPGCSNLPAGVA